MRRVPHKVRSRTRRSPQQAEQEILDAAERLLATRPFRALSVPDLMAEAGLGRSSFWVYFRDRGDLARKLLARAEGEMYAAAGVWLDADGQPLDDLRSALRGVVEAYARRGPVLRAVADAASQDEDVELVYRWGVLESFISAVASRLEREVTAGRLQVAAPAELARALIMMNERYLADTLGRSTQPSAEVVTSVLHHIWRGAMNGAATPRPSGD